MHFFFQSLIYKGFRGWYFHRMSKKYHCGVSRWTPRWIRRILSIHFNEACYVHDLDHNNGEDLKKADLRFLDNMQMIAGLNPFLRLQAWVYYFAVRIYSQYKTWKTQS